MKPTNKQSLLLGMLIVLSQILSGCFTFKPMLNSRADLPMDKAEIIKLVEPGNACKVVLNDGRKFFFRKVTDVTPEAIVGKAEYKSGHVLMSIPNCRIRLTEIAGIRKRKFSIWKTALLGGGVLTAGPLIYLILHQKDQKGGASSIQDQDPLDGFGPG